MTGNLPMFYREIAPQPELSGVVLSFWEFTVSGDSSEPIVHEVFPDGCVSLVYQRNERFKISRLFVSGLQFESIKIKVFTGDVFWAMRVSPAACRRLLRETPPTEQFRFVGDFPVLASFADKLTAELNGCVDFESAVAAFESEMRQINIKDVDQCVAAAVRLIEENQTQLKIEEIAAAVGLSRRQFERRFSRSSGLTPKQYLRARRLRATAVKLVEDFAANWASRAAEMGFADQAHLAHEFSALTNRTPVSFAERVKQIEHGKLLK